VSFALLNATTFVGGYDFTGTMNQLALTGDLEELDSTVFGSVARSRTAGLQDVTAQLVGFWDAGTGQVDPVVFAALGGGVQVATHTPNGTAGDVAYMYQAREFSYNLFGEVGQLAPYTLSLMGSSGNAQPGLIRGRLAAAKGNVAATGAFGSVVELGAVAAGEYLYLAFHVFTAGTTISVKVQSDDNAGMSSATDVASATIGPITAAGGTWMTRVAGPITDTHFRLNATAVTGTFNVAAALGVK
jgi:hypothetical protein